MRGLVHCFDHLSKGDILTDQETVEILTDQEARLLLQQIEEPRDKAIVLLFLTTGLYLHELATLTLSSIDWEKKTVTVTGKRPRTLPLSDPTHDVLCVWSKHRVSAETNALFLTTKGKLSPLSERSIDHLIRKHAQAANLSHSVNAQTLRNTYATHLFKAEISDDEAAKLLGFADKESLHRYRNSSSFAEASADKPSQDYLDTRSFTEKLFKPEPNPGTVLCKPNDIDIPPEVIFGRESLIKELRSSIYHNEPVILIGQIGIGKTHLLKHLQTIYPNSLYVPAKPLKTLLITLANHLNSNWEKEVGGRASVTKILDWILKNSHLKMPLLLIDDCHAISANDTPLFMSLLQNDIPVVMASIKLLEKTPKLQWRLKTLEVKELSDDASLELINYLTQGLPITDDCMLETRMMSLGNGVPAALVEMARQLRYHPVINPEVVRKIYHEAGIRYRDWTPAIVVIWAMIVCSRFIALGLHSFEGYILAGVGTAIFLVGKYFLMRMR
jgi:energy-coupling factor transporter ATP-binding protein EcfA2